jgi:hypothetical protein
MSLCSGIRADGGRCKAQAMRNSQWCLNHDPSRAEARRRRASKGGKRGGRGRPQTELAALKAEVRDVIEAVRTGELDKGVGAVLGQLYNVLLKAVSVGLDVEERQELVQRMEALEEALEQNRRTQYGAS